MSHSAAECGTLPYNSSKFVKEVIGLAGSVGWARVLSPSCLAFAIFFYFLALTFMTNLSHILFPRPTWVATERTIIHYAYSYYIAMLPPLVLNRHKNSSGDSTSFFLAYLSVSEWTKWWFTSGGISVRYNLNKIMFLYTFLIFVMWIFTRFLLVSGLFFVTVYI